MSCGPRGRGKPGRTGPPGAPGLTATGATKPTFRWVSPEAPTMAWSILTTAMRYSAVCFSPGNCSALTVVSSIDVTLPTMIMSAVTTRWAMVGGGAMTRKAEADWVVTSRATHDRPANAAHKTRRMRSLLYRETG